MTEPLLVGPRDAARIAGTGRDFMYELVRSGRVRSVRIGARRLIPRQELEAWIARELEANEGGDAMTDTAPEMDEAPTRVPPARA
jgi:excisionase family DNA binding protein